MNRTAAFLLAALALIALVGGRRALRLVRPRPACNRDSTVQIGRGDTLSGAARSLEKAGVIRSARGLSAWGAKAFSTGKPIRFGEYFIPGSASASDVLKTLEQGDVLRRLVTIPEGMPSVLVRDKLIAEPLLTGTVAVPAEGSVLPDSYSFERGEARQKVLDRMQAAMKAELAKDWAKRKPSTVVKTPAEAVNLAAIVEKETGKGSERRIVAGVYSNRLRIGMKLDADPTVIYPITQGKPARPPHQGVRAPPRHRLQHLCKAPGLPRGPDRQPRPRLDRGGARPGFDQGPILRRRWDRGACVRGDAGRA